MQLFYHLLVVIILLFSTTVFAAPSWEIIPSESKITFTGTLNNSPFSGQFKKFSGEIKGDIDQIDKSNVLIIIDTNSISTSYKDIEDTLKTPDWLHVDIFPNALFEANSFKKITDKEYQAKGKLTIRNKTIPLTVNFIVNHYTGNKGSISGSTIIKRTDFGIGTGEWGSTDEVKDEVKIDFNLTARKK